MLDHGIGLALRASGRDLVPLLYVEREAFPAACLAWQMEEGILAPAPIWSDVGSLAGRDCAQHLEGFGVDLLFGGIPCQPHSQAGKRLGADDPRDLWPATAQAIEVYRPGVVFIENVSGIALANEPAGAGARVVLDLERMGYRATLGFFSSEECGASHGRLRCFIYGHLENADRGHGQLANAGGRSLGRNGRATPCSQKDDEGRPEVDSNRAQRGRRPERRGADRGSGASLPRYAPHQSAYELWRIVADTRPNLLPATGRTKAKSKFQRVAHGLAPWPYGAVPRALRLAAVGNGVDPVVAALAFLTLEACSE
jgi:DNA (cytosine-5)-methyltransferase 1